MAQKFKKITLYKTGCNCHGNASYKQLVDYVVENYRGNYGVFDVKRTEISKEYQKKLISAGLDPKNQAVEYIYSNGRGKIVSYNEFLNIIEKSDI